VLFVFVLTSVVGLALIFLFVISEGFPIFTKVGIFQFLFGRIWVPTRGQFGLLPLILTSLIVIVGSVVVAAPLGISLAIFMAEYAPGPVRAWLKALVELLAGIPSVVI
jgi:phosphate transport system permease protein